MGEQVVASLFFLRITVASWGVRSTNDAWLNHKYGGVAQLGEHLPCKQGVMSSNLTISTQAMSIARSTGYGRNACIS